MVRELHKIDKISAGRTEHSGDKGHAAESVYIGARSHIGNDLRPAHNYHDSSHSVTAKQHLPNLKIVESASIKNNEQAKSEEGRDAAKEKLVKQVVNADEKPQARLQAAHKLSQDGIVNLHSNQDGKTHHFKVVESKIDKDHSKVSLFEVSKDGVNKSLVIQGVVDSKGQVELTTPKPSESKTRSAGHDTSHGGYTKDVSITPAASRVTYHAKHRSHSYFPSAASDSFPQSSYSQDSSQPDTSNSAKPEINFQPYKTNIFKSDDKFIGLTQLENGLVYARTALAVDSDGGDEWQDDHTGQAQTSLTDSKGRSLNAKHVPFFVLPLTKEYAKFGIKLGDIAWVRNTQNGKVVQAVFGDHGPAGKLGEGSQALCRGLGLSDNPNSGGTSSKIIEFFIQPGSGNGKGDIAHTLAKQMNNPELVAAKFNSSLAKSSMPSLA